MSRVAYAASAAALVALIGAPPTHADPSANLCHAEEQKTSSLLLEARREASVGAPEIRYGDPWSPAHDAKAALAAHLERRRAALARAKNEGDRRLAWALARSTPTDDVFVDLTPSLFPAGECQATPRGAWAFGVSDVTTTVRTGGRGGLWPEWSGVLTLTHLGIRGDRVTVALEACCGERFDGDVANDPPVFFDYDGDGEPEVLFHGRLVLDGPTDRGPTVVLTFKDGAIIPYAPLASTQTVGAVQDFDADGRPDLVAHGGVLVHPGEHAACGLPPPEGYSPAFLVHSLPSGGFSTSDDVARRYARTWSPASPSTILDAADAGCARLWANTPERVAAERARVVASCVEVDERTCKGKPAPPLGLGCSLRTQAFDVAPPFILP